MTGGAAFVAARFPHPPFRSVAKGRVSFFLPPKLDRTCALDYVSLLGRNATCGRIT